MMLGIMGTYLGHEQRKDFSARLYMGNDHGSDARRAERKQCLTENTSSRWAGSMTRTSNTEFNTGIANLKEELKYLCAAMGKIKSRLSVPAGEYDKKKKVRGYKDASEVAMKKRRLGVLQDKLVGVCKRLKDGRPRVVLGCSRLWRHKENLEAAELTAEQWRDQWDTARMFLTADGTSGERNGNQTIRVTPEGKVQIKIPGALVEMFGIGEHLILEHQVKFYNKAGELQDRITTNQAIRYDICYDTDPKKTTKPWSLSASWKIKESPYLPTPENLTFGNQLAIDCNDQFFSCRVVDQSGNPVGKAMTIHCVWKDLPAPVRDGHLRDAICEMIRLAKEYNCVAIVIENLNFEDSRSTGRETMGRGNKGKRFRKTVAGIPTAQIRDRLAAMVYNADLWLIAVDPAYTTKWGTQHWQKPLEEQRAARRGKTTTLKHGKQTQTFEPVISSHDGAAPCIGRRSMGFTLKRKKRDPKADRVTALGQPDSSLEPKPKDRSTTWSKDPPNPCAPRLGNRTNKVSKDGQLGNRTEQSTSTVRVDKDDIGIVVNSSTPLCYH